MAASATSRPACSRCCCRSPSARWGWPAPTLPGSRFLLVGTGVYGWLARDAYYFQLRAQRRRRRRKHARVARSRGQELFPRNSAWGALITAADETRTWGLMFLYFVSFGGFLALTAWFPTYWINLHHLSLTSAGILGGVGFSLLAAVTRVAGGPLAEKFGGEIMAGDRLHHRADRRGVADRGDRLPDQRRGRAADRPRHGPGQCRGVQDGAEIRAARGRRRIRPGRRPRRAGRLRHPAGAGPVRRRAGRRRLLRRLLLLRRAGASRRSWSPSASSAPATVRIAQ